MTYIFKVYSKIKRNIKIKNYGNVEVKLLYAIKAYFTSVFIAHRPATLDAAEKGFLSCFLSQIKHRFLFSILLVCREG